MSQAGLFAELSTEDSKMTIEPTIEQLQTQIDALQAKMLELQARRRDDVIAAINKMLKENGMTLSDLCDGKSKSQSTGKRMKSTEREMVVRTEPGQYKNPADGQIIDYKRGRKPAWMASMAADELAQCKIN
jgi:DNA-binding protein H-NS